ncbi:MAG: thiamine phosphate synthase [Variovorax sp.]|nr:thiamine phosphate synthase [Variovorax sp.]
MAEEESHGRARRRRVLAIVNAGAGTVVVGGRAIEEAIAEIGANSGLVITVEPVDGDSIERAARRGLEAARDGRFDVIAVGGGDGTIRAAATLFADTGVPLAILPLGTLNHFARDVGIPGDLAAAVGLIATGEVRAVDAGVPTVQLRFKPGDARAMQGEVRAAVAAVQGTPALLFINDHWQAAIEAGAYGVHLGQEDLDALTESDVDAIRRAGLRLGVSTHGYAEMQRADAVSPSYLALGAVFPTTLKQMATAPQGLTRLKCYAQLMHGYPLVAIGGFDVSRVPAAMAAGVGSVAVVRAIVGADDPEGAARALMDSIAAHPPAAGR